MQGWYGLTHGLWGHHGRTEGTCGTGYGTGMKMGT